MSWWHVPQIKRSLSSSLGKETYALRLLIPYKLPRALVTLYANMHREKHMRIYRACTPRVPSHPSAGSNVCEGPEPLR
jgi:hypothetical protein